MPRSAIVDPERSLGAVTAGYLEELAMMTMTRAVSGGLGLLAALALARPALAAAEASPLAAIWAAGESERHYHALTIDAQGNAYAVGEVSTPGQEGGNSTACVVTKYDPTGNPLWSRQAQAKGSSNGYAAAVDGLGNVYAGGTMLGSDIDFGDKAQFSISDGSAPGMASSRIFLAKFDAKGKALWVQATQGRESASLNSLAADSEGNVYLTGRISSGETDPAGPLAFVHPGAKPRFIPESSGDSGGSFLAKLDARGAPLWVACPGGGYVNLYAVAVDGSGAVFATGTANGEGTVSFGNGVLLPGGVGPLLVKFGSNGAAQWARGALRIGGLSILDCLAVDPTGNLYAAGTFYGAVDLDFGNGASVKGSSELNPILVKFDATGKAQWARSTVGGTAKWYMRGVASDASGAYIALRRMEGKESERCELGEGVGFTGGFSIVGYAATGEPRWAVPPPGDMGGTWAFRSDGRGHLYLIADAAYGGPSDFGDGVVLAAARYYIAKYGLGARGFATCVDVRVRVRSAGSLDAGTLGYLDKGDRLEILERSAGQAKVEAMSDYWYRVRRVTDGLSGWSYGAFLKVEP
jgi:hypothetical protein